MQEHEIILLAFTGVGVFIGGLIAYCDPKIKANIAIGVMIVGITIMLICLLIKDAMTGFIITM